MRITTILVLLLIIAGVVITVNYGLDLSKKEDRTEFAGTYTGYLMKVAQNAKELAKQATKQDWSIEENINTNNSVTNP